MASMTKRFNQSPAGSRILALLILSVLAASSVRADTRGKLTGAMTDKSKSAIIGASIVIVGSSLGAATDIDGYYVIMNIPPGVYDVRITGVGYETKVIKGIRIASGQTTTLNETLSEEIIQSKEVVVTAERPIVDTRQTSAVSILGEDQISVLPVQSLQDIVNLQAGVVDGHFRGGRIGEVQYQVDGVSVNNPYDNSSSVSLDRSVLQEVQVISGTFDAEYGQAMSGVVNAVLRSGRNDAYEWSAELYCGDYVSFGYDEHFPHLERLNPIAIRSMQASISGPLPLDKTTFLLSARRYENEGYLYGERRFLPTDSANFETKVFRPSGDNKLVSMQTNDEWSGQFKIANASLKDNQFSYQAIFNVSHNKNYSYAYRFNPDGMKTPESMSLVHGLDWTLMMSEKTYATVNLRQNYFDYKDYKYENIYDPRYLTAGQPIGDPNYEHGAIVQGVDLGRFTQKTSSYVIKAAVTSQVTSIHLLKIGFEGQVSDLSFGSPGVLVQTTVAGRQTLLPHVDDPNYPGVKSYRPFSFSAFAQDRIEWQDVMVRAGVRAEYFDPNTTVPSNLQNPANTIAGAPQSHLQAATKKIAVAPRLGISYPVIAGGSLYFSYGHFYQFPGLGQFFSNSDYSVLKELQAGAVTYGVMGNPDLKPEFTAQYEFGVKAQLSESFGIDASIFYKDIRDLLGVEFISTYSAAEYARLTNVDFGGVSGVTIALDHRSFGLLSSTVDYTYQVAMGNSSDARETATRASAGEDPRPRVVPFSWDQRHTVNTTITVQSQNNYSATVIIRFGTGQPYTPSVGSGFGAGLESNSGRKASSAVVDLRGEKYFSFAGISMSAFMRLYNLFNTSFSNGFVFANTGSPDYSLNSITDYVQLHDPSRYYAPRRLEIGISLKGSTQAP